MDLRAAQAPQPSSILLDPVDDSELLGKREAVLRTVEAWQQGGNLEELEGMLRMAEVTHVRNDKGDNLAAIAAKRNFADILGLILRLDTSALQVKDQEQRSLLHLSLSSDQADPAEVVRTLLGAGLAASLPDAQGSTPLHLAAKHGHTDSLSELLKCRCNPNAQNGDGDTPLHLAVRHRKLKCMELLLAAGATPSLINYSRRTAKQEASGAALAVLSKFEKPVKSLTRRWEETKPPGSLSWHKTDFHTAKTSTSQEPGKTQKDPNPSTMVVKGRELMIVEDKRPPVSLEKQLEEERKAKEQALTSIQSLQQSLAQATTELTALKEQLSQVKSRSEVKLLFPTTLGAIENVIPQLQVDMEQFSEEVRKWQTACKPVFEKAIRQVRMEVKTIWPDCDLEEYGSFANSLNLPNSDIDLVIVGSNSPSQLSELSQAIRLHVPITSMSLVATAFIPVLKIEMTLDSLDIRIDITQQDPRHTGVKCSQVVKRKIEEIPRLREVNLVVKHLFQLCDFTEPFKGGVSSYGIFLMVLYFFQHHLPPCEDRYSLAEPLLHFLNFYAWNFNYHDAICVQEAVYDPTFFPQSLDPYLVIVDPISPTRNVGHNTNLEALLVILRLATKYLQREPGCKCQTQVLLNMMQETKSAISWS